MKQVFVFAACCSWLVIASPAHAQQELTSRDILRVLQIQLDMKDFQNPMTLKEALGLLHEKFASKGIDLPILVNQQAFNELHPGAIDVYESVVRLPPYPKQMPLATALQIAVSQANTGDATYLVRRGWVEVTTTKAATLPALLKQKVMANFERKALEEIFHELAEQSALSIQLDPRVKEKLTFAVSAVFRNDTTLRDALVMLADMGGLQAVELPSAVYITTPANAELLRKFQLKNESLFDANRQASFPLHFLTEFHP